jgi:hypothetical protein
VGGEARAVDRMILKEFDWKTPGEVIGHVTRPECVLDLAILVQVSGLKQVEAESSSTGSGP